MSVATELKGLSGTKPAELLRRALTEKQQQLYVRLSMEQDSTQMYRLQGRITEVNDLLKLLEP